MKYNTNLIKSLVSFGIGEVRFEDNVFLPINKNGEDLELIINNKRSYSNFCKNIYLQKQYDVLNKSTDIKLLQTLEDRKSNWILTDNNLNFIQCFDDYEYSKLCTEARERFFRDKERWAIGELESIPLNSSIKLTKTVRLIHNEGINTNFKYSKRKSNKFSQRIYLHKTKEFVYIKPEYEEFSRLENRNVFFKSANVTFNSELVYLFNKSNNKNQLHLNTVFNRSWFYK